MAQNLSTETIRLASTHGLQFRLTGPRSEYLQPVCTCGGWEGGHHIGDERLRTHAATAEHTAHRDAADAEVRAANEAYGASIATEPDYSAFRD